MRFFGTIIMIGMIILSGCSSGPKPIDFGSDQCKYCMMTITDPRYGAELLTKKGRVYKYDAAECLINHMKKEKITYRSLWGIAYDDPKNLYRVDELTFIIDTLYRSPMGANLAAFNNQSGIPERLKNQKMEWKEVFNNVESFR